MKLKTVNGLKPGDQVFWNDPDPDGDCSRYYTIETVEVYEGTLVRIEEPDGSFLECTLRELDEAYIHAGTLEED